MRDTNGAVGLARDVLSAARGHVRRRSRTPTYFEHADRFAQAFVGKSLGLATEDWKVVVADLPVILDTCYEEVVAAGEAVVNLSTQMTARLQELLDASNALRALPVLSSALSVPECSFKDVASGLLAAAVTLGHASLSSRTSAKDADAWVGFWGERVWRHNHQQEIHSITCALPALLVPDHEGLLSALGAPFLGAAPKSKTFSEGVREYLASFSDTAAASMAMVGVLPFATKPIGANWSDLFEFLRTTPDFFAAMDDLMRLAQDVRFDPSEPLSCGVFALAAERGVPVTALNVRELDTAELEKKLAAEWASHARDCRARLEASLATLQTDGPPRRTLAEIAETTCLIAEALTVGRPKG